jgi:light-regulated signal transduction histidine kinase (bacteriophytochrome)
MYLETDSVINALVVEDRMVTPRKKRAAKAAPVPTEGFSSEQILRLNADLERRVLERTAQLEASNKELEAFCYSVSHDLRAPLRSIDGFTHALLESYAESLDPIAREYLQRVRAASLRMSQLIDDLLHLSRVGRREMRIQEVDLSELAASVAHDLQKADPTRKVQFTIEPALHARADERLIRIALENLLGNSWKFTSHTPAAQIEFGCEPQEDRRVYFVRDNGAGFDMTYADKLFTPFQRLHASHEFPGSGIGLAIVQRIINRHNGTVSALGAPNKGATFSFTLGEPGNAKVGAEPPISGA